MWTFIFRVKWCSIGMHDAMARIGLETNLSGDVSLRKEKAPLPQWICWLKESCQMIFYICYHAGDFAKHLPRPKVKRRVKELFSSDALTPKKRKTLLEGKMRTYLWTCPLTPTPQPHPPAPYLCKIRMRGSNKIAWIDAIRTTHYPLILMLCCNVFMFLVKQRVFQEERYRVTFAESRGMEAVGASSQNWGGKIKGVWQTKWRLLWKNPQNVTTLEKEKRDTWTYKVPHDALCHQFVKRTDLVQKLCRQQHKWLYTLLTHS